MILKKKIMVALSAACLLTAPGLVSAEGFGINEWSAEGVAMGGARMFAEDDPANLAYNPAGLTKIKGEGWKSGAVYVSPHGRYKAYDKDGKLIESGKNVVSPGILPHFYYVRQIDEKQWFGIGSFVRFGMISEFGKESAVRTNAYRSELKGISLTPTYAWKPDAKFSAAIGAEINHVGLSLQKRAMVPNVGEVDTKTKGDSTALGWNAAVNYAFDEKNEVGLVYRSKITHTMEADFKSSFAPMNSKAHGKVVLPDTFALGYNHKFDDKTRVELNGTYTRWSTYDKLDIYFDNPMVPDNKDPKDWKNGWRYAIGVEHKLSDKYTAMAGFAYDESAIPDERADFMIPTGARRTYSLGVQYHDKKQTLALTLGQIDIGGKSITAKKHAQETFDHAYTHGNYAKVIAIGYERKL
ncbi:MAG TPA: outer membrane protein transport protein [Candidatus Avacidaminococcus intestinavium]|uniref:Outer membrane protein transport protein n=1 Tax=Candidatus Avacidaminococcus intestinavium TaxID=2840684 RepID=A0A9D1MRC8_9FIRM|nr:outer membrane protein transport protein [Candidatus Avacidaminococcus intestinavium]